MTNYGIDNIETLTFREGVRKRVAMYVGSADMQGVYAAIQEIISNSVDEYYMGFGDRIDISLHDNTIKISDKGRGIPFGIRENGDNVLVDIFTKSHTGGKFSEKSYQSVAGLNGIGAKATCLSSTFFNVETYRPEGIARASFRKGELLSYAEVPNPTGKQGTSIEFTPDPEVYNLEPIDVIFSIIAENCKNLSYLTKGLTFALEDTLLKKKVTYCAKNGLLDLLKDNVEDAVHPTPIYYELSSGNTHVEIALQWTRNNERVYTFTNGLYHSEGGTSLTGLRSAITRNMKKVLGLELPSEMIRTGLVYAISCKVQNPSFANQTKTKINNPELRSLADKAFSEAINIFKDKYPNDIDNIKEFFAKEKKADEAANRAREAVMNHTKIQSEASKKKVLLAGKLKDCREHGPDSVLVIVEGDSALGSLQSARNIDRTALQPIRGKIINALRNPIEDVLENAEVNDIILSLGCGINGNYNAKKLRYGSIAMAVDGDADGYNIMCLITVLFYKLMPKFIEEGRLKWLRAPLYKIKYSKQTLFAYDDDELKVIQKKHGMGTVSRIKGLGELDTEDIRNSMFHTKDQRLEVLTYFDKDVSNTQLEMLMGDDVLSRREFIMDNIDFELLED